MSPSPSPQFSLHQQAPRSNAHHGRVNLPPPPSAALSSAGLPVRYPQANGGNVFTHSVGRRRSSIELGTDSIAGAHSRSGSTDKLLPDRRAIPLRMLPKSGSARHTKDPAQDSLVKSQYQRQRPMQATAAPPQSFHRNGQDVTDGQPEQPVQATAAPPHSVCGAVRRAVQDHGPCTCKDVACATVGCVTLACFCALCVSATMCCAP